MLTVKKRKEKEEVERRAFNYLLKDEENPKLCYFYYSYYLYMKKYVDLKIILLLFCYCVYNKAYGKYLSYIQVIFNKKLRKRETRYRINPSERPLKLNLTSSWASSQTRTNETRWSCHQTLRSLRCSFLESYNLAPLF